MPSDTIRTLRADLMPNRRLFSHILVGLGKPGWKVFPANGSMRTVGHYAKLAYGVFGAAFLVFISFVGNAGERENAPKGIAPSVWYLRWIWNSSSTESRNGYYDDGSAESATNTHSTEFDRTAFPWGTDGSGRNLRIWIGRGARDYLRFGAACALLALAVGLGLSLLVEWPARPRIPLPHRVVGWQKWLKRIGDSFLEITNTIPKYMLLIAIATIGGKNPAKFTLGVALFAIFGLIVLFRERIGAYLSSEPYLYALEMGLRSERILWVHLVAYNLVPFLLVQIPYVLSSFILWESTLSFMNWQLFAESWGVPIQQNMHKLDWGLWIPLTSLVLVISSLYILGDALKERVAWDR